MRSKLIALQILTVVALFVQLLTGIALAAANQLVLSSSQNYQVGQEFAVSYKVEGNDLLAVITKVNFDPSVLSFVKIDNTGTVFPGEIVFTPNSNNLDIVKTTYDFKVASGSSLIATLYFKPIKKGTTQITATGSAADKAGTALGLASGSLSVPVGVTVASSPTPGAKQTTPTTTSTTSTPAPTTSTTSTPANTATPPNQSPTNATQEPNGTVAPDADPQVKAIVAKIKSQRGTSPATKQRRLIIGVGAFIGVLLILLGVLYWRSRRLRSVDVPGAAAPISSAESDQTAEMTYPQNSPGSQPYAEPIVVAPQEPQAPQAPVTPDAPVAPAAPVQSVPPVQASAPTPTIAPVTPPMPVTPQQPESLEPPAPIEHHEPPS